MKLEKAVAQRCSVKNICTGVAVNIDSLNIVTRLVIINQRTMTPSTIINKKIMIPKNNNCPKTCYKIQNNVNNDSPEAFTVLFEHGSAIQI